MLNQKRLRVKKVSVWGEYDYFSHEKITCIQWNEQRPKNLILNYYNATNVGTTNRRNKNGALTKSKCQTFRNMTNI